MSKLSLRSKVLVKGGTGIWGDPRAWGLDCTPEEFYCMPSERVAANHSKTLHPANAGKHASMVRNLEVELVRQKVRKQVSITFTALALTVLTATTLVSFGYQKASNLVSSVKTSMQSKDALKERKALLEKQAKQVQDDFAAGKITQADFSTKLESMQEEYKRVQEELAK